MISPRCSRQPASWHAREGIGAFRGYGGCSHMVHAAKTERGPDVARRRRRRRRHGLQPCARPRGNAGRAAGRRRRSRSQAGATSSARTLGCPARRARSTNCSSAASMPCRSRRRPICIATSRSPASSAASMCWSRSRSPPSVEEGDDIIAAARRAGVTLMVGHVERFNPAVQAIKEAIRDEDILSIAITRVGPFPPRMSNVGVVIDLAVHDIDLICWFTDSEIVEVQPQLSSAVAEREDIALLQFRTASGVLAHINTNWLTPFKARTVHVATKRKYVIGDLLTRQVTECFGFQPDGSYSMRHLSVGHAEPLRAELHGLRQGRSGTHAAAGHRRGGRREPRHRHPVPRRPLAMRRPDAQAPRRVAGCRAALNRRSRSHERAGPVRPVTDSVHRRRGAAPPARRQDRRRGRARARPLPVHSRPRGARARAGAGGILRRAPRGHLRERHRCARCWC